MSDASAGELGGRKARHWKRWFVALLNALHLAPLTLFVWYQRSCFRAELLADLRYRPEYLGDIGICRHEATSETTRFFWEPVLLRRS